MLEYSEIKTYPASRSSHGYSYEERDVHCSVCGGHIGTQHRLSIDENFKYEIPLMKFYNNCPYCGEKL